MKNDRVWDMCGVFIPDRVLAGWWRSERKASDRMGAGRYTTGCGSASLHPPTYEDGTDRGFRNVGY